MSPSTSSSTQISPLDERLATFLAGLVVSAGWMDAVGESARSRRRLLRAGVEGGVVGCCAPIDVACEGLDVNADIACVFGKLR